MMRVTSIPLEYVTLYFVLKLYDTILGKMNPTKICINKSACAINARLIILFPLSRDLLSNSSQSEKA